MIKPLLALCVLAFSFPVLACNNITKQSVVLFIDANNSPLEIEKAREAACQRGEDIVVAGPNEVEARARQLANSNKPISSLVASGHDGGGHFYGSRGSINKSAIIQGIQRGYQGKEDLLDELEGILLWGCYTTVPSEVVYWKSAFPSAKFIIGFHGSGPSNINPSGLRMLKSSLIKQGEICAVRSQERMRQLITSISDLRYTSVGVFAHSCNMDENFYLMQRLNNEGVLDRTFGTLESNLNCTQIRNIAQANINRFHNYFSGSIPVPEDTSGSELRELYSFVRQNAQCFENDFVTGDRVGSLLFFHGVKRNFAKVFERDISDAEAELGQLSRHLDSVSFTTEEAAITRAEAALSRVEAAQRTITTEQQNLRTKIANKEASFASMSRRTRRYMEALRDGNNARAENRADRLNDREAAALAEINRLKTQEVNLNQRLVQVNSEVASATSNVNSLKADKQRKEASLADMKNKLVSVRREFWLPNMNNISNKTRAQVLQNISKLSSLTNHEFLNGSSALQQRVRKLKGLENKMERYLNQLDPACMNFLEWHEFLPNQTPAPRC